MTRHTRAVVVIVSAAALALTAIDGHSQAAGAAGGTPKATGKLDPKIQMLIGAARDINVELRMAAIGSLGKTKSPAAVEPLMAIAEDSDAKVRAAAMRALVVIGDKRCLQLYIDALGDRDTYVQTTALAGLADLADPRSVPALVGTLADSAPGSSRTTAIQAALVKLGDPAVDALVTSVRKRPYFGDSAAATLAKIGTTRAQAALAGLASDKNWRIRFIALHAATAAAKPPITTLCAAARDTRPALRIEAAVQLRKHLSSPKALEAMISLLSDSNSRVQRQAAEALCRSTDKRLTAPFAAMLNSPDVTARRYAADYLVRNSGPTIVPFLALAVEDEDTHVRQRVVEALIRSGSKDAIRHIVKALNDKQQSIASMAFAFLSKADGPETIKAMTEFLRSGTPAQRVTAASRLGELGDASATKPLAHSLQTESNVAVRRAAAKALRKFEGPLVLSIMLKALASDPDVEVRTIACHGLGQGEETIKALMAAAGSDKEPTIRQMAMDSLRGLAPPKRIIPLFGEMLSSDPSANVRNVAAGYLAVPPLSGKAAKEFLVAAAGTEKNTYVLAKIVLGLARADEPVAVSKALPRLVDAAARDRNAPPDLRRVIRFLALAKNADAIEGLLYAVKNGTTPLRAEAVTALGWLGSAAAVTSLTAAAKDPSIDIATRAITSLGRIGHKTAEQALLVMLKEAALASRKHAITRALVLCDSRKHFVLYVELLKAGLGKPLVPHFQAARTKDVTEVLIALLADKDPNIRIQALVELEHVGDDRAAKAIDKLRSDPQLSSMAMKILKQLTPPALNDNRR